MNYRVRGVERHVVEGSLIGCRAGEPQPLSVRQNAEQFLDWLKAHNKVPGNEVPVAILERFPTRIFCERWTCR